MNEQKATIRERMRELGAGMAVEQRARDSRQACAWLVGMEQFEKADVVGMYLATATEVDTADMVISAHERGKTVCVPAWHAATHAYSLCWLRPDAERRVGRCQIAEPSNPQWIDQPVDLIVVPGLAFDASGGRVGHGGGFYDRLTVGERVREATRVGLAFDWQVVANVPMCDHDVRMDAVVTEKGVLQIGG